MLDSDCGYHHQSRDTKHRKTPIDFTGCLAHGEVLYQKHTGKILLVRGYFEHNLPCRDAFLSRIPPIPLHPSVFEVALKQLRGGAELSDIQELNRKLFRTFAYAGQPRDMRQSSHRWLLRKTDTRSLYRQFNRIRGINVVQPAHVNVDDWLDSASPAYNAAFAEAFFHYSARATQDDRFEVCIATKQMKEASWTYAHDSQIILDGTFGLCDKKLLLFIVMGLDGQKRGVPLAFLLFSAPSGNQQTSSGYNTEILTRLLTHWRTSLGTRNGMSFSPRVAITDTDLKERGALLKVFTGLWLLICKFHLRQSWRNNRSRVLKGNSTYHTVHTGTRPRPSALGRNLEAGSEKGANSDCRRQLHSCKRQFARAAHRSRAVGRRWRPGPRRRHPLYQHTKLIFSHFQQSFPSTADRSAPVLAHVCDTPG